MACGNKENESMNKVVTKFSGERHDPNLDQQIQPLLNQYFAVMAHLQEQDSADLVLAKSDTLKITTKSISDYGNIVLRFKNVDLTKNTVVQFVQNDEVKKSFKITSTEWSDKLFIPGEYELRILFDSNNNGKWDTGNYTKIIQPEKVITLPQKLSIKANWDNERDIEL